MASSKEYLEFIIEQLSEFEKIKYRAMMGEYIIYYKEKVVGGIYDDRFLVKNTKSAKKIYEQCWISITILGLKRNVVGR